MEDGVEGCGIEVFVVVVMICMVVEGLVRNVGIGGLDVVFG